MFSNRLLPSLAYNRKPKLKLVEELAQVTKHKPLLLQPWSPKKLPAKIWTKYKFKSLVQIAPR